MKIRISILTLIIALVTFTNCSNDDDNNSQIQYQSTAIIKGENLDTCICCDGYLIDINGQEPNKSFSELPQSSSIDIENTSFPIYVQLNWTGSDDGVCTNRITIQQIELNE